ncbi:hypothetical protein Emag_002814 [Eimeria magna]
MIPQGPPRPTLVRYGPCVEVAADSPEATAATAEGGREDVEDRKEAHVSTAAADRVDVLKTREDLDIQLLERRASETGVCPCRYDAVLQCFDELIRQVAILCPERALLLLRVKDEIKLTIAALEVLCRSSINFSALKQIQTQTEDVGVTQQQARTSSRLCTTQFFAEES